MSNIQPDQINRALDYTTKLIQFSWTASALLLTAQGWQISKLYAQNRNFKWWHLFSLASCAVNVFGLICLLYWYEQIVAVALKENVDFFLPEIVAWRERYFNSTLFSIVNFGIGFIFWAYMKSKPGKPEGVGK